MEPRTRPRELLYVHFGPQSGVVESVATELRRLGMAVDAWDVARTFLYKTTLWGRSVPNLRPDVATAVWKARRLHGRHWRHFYFHTRFAFDRMTRLAGRAIARHSPSVVLQSGALFAPGQPSVVPYYLYLDHTKAIAERYEAVPGELPPLPFDLEWRARERSVYRNAEGIFVMSQFVRDSLIEDYGADPARVHVVGAGANVEATPTREPSQRQRAFLFVGLRFVPKGGRELLKAFERVRQRHPDVELWVVSNYSPLESPPGVHFLGRLAKVDLAERYARASWFVLPTLREAFGLSYVEAMGFGLPCIGTNLEAIPEIITNDVTGLLVERGDVDGLAQAMLGLLANPARAASMGEAGRVRAGLRFGWARTVRQMFQVMQGRSPAAVPERYQHQSSELTVARNVISVGPGHA